MKGENIMAYIPTVWSTGDVITAGKLNKMEGGIAAAGPLLVTVTADGADYHELDKSYKEITEAASVRFHGASDEYNTDADFILIATAVDNGTYYVDLAYITISNNEPSLVYLGFTSDSETGTLIQGTPK